MRRGVVGAAGLIGILVLTGCGLRSAAPDRPISVASQQIDGIRSDPDHRGLVVSYTGGGCDGPARLVLTESKTRIKARVMVKQPSGQVNCAAVGIPRTVRARLVKPIGHRQVWAAGRHYVPFDGARLLVPSVLPRGFGRPLEMGGSTGSASAAAAPVVTTTWVTSYNSHAAEIGAACPAARGWLEVRIGPATGDQSHGWTKVGTVKVGAAAAGLFRAGASKRPTGWAYIWTTHRSSVEVDNTANCKGDRLLSKTELLRVAESLRP